MTGSVQQSQRSAAKVAGAAYLCMVLGGILYWVLVVSRLSAPGDAAAAAGNVLAHEGLFRLGVGYELLMVANLVALAMAHHVMLKPIGRQLAAVGLYSVLVEAFLAAAMVLAAFVALQFLNGAAKTTTLGRGPLLDLVGRYLDVRNAGHTISTVFLSVGMIAFQWLLYRSRYVPRPLAAFGVFSYAAMLLAALVNVLVPGSPPTLMAMQRPFDVACVVPSILLEMAAGAWLLFKGLEERRGTAS